MSYPAYPEYKNFNEGFLGKVPSTWSISPLKHNCTILPSNVDKHTDPGETAVRLCNYTDVYYQDRIVESLDLMKASASRDQIEKFTLQAQDVVITKDSESADDIAIPSFVPRSLPNVVCGYHLAIIRPSQAVDGLFLNYLLMAKPLRAYFEISARGLTRVGLSQFALGGTEVAWPPKEEQTQIARFLDHQTARIDALIAEQQRLIELLKEKRQAVISHAVTKGLDPDAAMKDSGVEWLKEVPSHWEVRKLSTVTDKITNGYVGPTRDLFVDDGIPYLQSLHIKNNQIIFSPEYYVPKSWSDEHSKSILKPDDVVIVQTGACTGELAVVPEDFPEANCHALIVASTIKQSLSGVWLSWVLLSDYGYSSLLSIRTGALHPHLNCGYIKDLYIPVPPIEEQKEIVNSLNIDEQAHHGLLSEAQSAIKISQERRSALISAAVTGKIDVRNWEPPSSETFPDSSVREGVPA